MNNNNEDETIKYFIRKKINTYLKRKPYSSNKIREKLLILPKRYPNHKYYPKYSLRLINEVIKQLEANKVINNPLFLKVIYQSLEIKPWSNKKIWDYLKYKQLFDKDLIKDFKISIPERDETQFIPEIIRKLKIKIYKWERKYDDYTLKRKIQHQLYKDKFKQETQDLILKKLKKEAP